MVGLERVRRLRMRLVINGRTVQRTLAMLRIPARQIARLAVRLELSLQNTPSLAVEAGTGIPCAPWLYDNVTGHSSRTVRA
jgi:hypothetical protein